MLEIFVWFACGTFAWITLVAVLGKASWSEYGKVLLYMAFGVVSVFGLVAFGPKDPGQFFVLFVVLAFVSYFVALALGQVS